MLEELLFWYVMIILAIKHVFCDDEGRAVAIDINNHGEYFHLVNFYWLVV